MIFLSPFQGFILHRIINGGSRPRLCSVVSSRLLLSPYELFFVRNTVGEVAKGRGEKFSPDTNIFLTIPAGIALACATRLDTSGSLLIHE